MEYCKELKEHLDDLQNQGYDFEYIVGLTTIIIGHNLDYFPKIYINSFGDKNIIQIINFYNLKWRTVKYSNSKEELISIIDQSMEEIRISILAGPILK